jgi:putative radical SAM enzyme (TIGR03279 family)
LLKINDIHPQGIGEELELEAGDLVIAVNGKPVRDLLDFYLYCADQTELLLEVQKKQGEIWELHIEKSADEDFGIEFEHPEPTQCGNNCLFCFVHQLPRGMRRTLYVKDEDYRFSYLYGSYITLTNIGEDEIERIVSQQLSPLYISVHATDDQLRHQLLGQKTPAILPLLKRLIDAGIQLHTQIVVCPGFNDGEQLIKTINDLYALSPGIRSLAVVPVGLTGYRQRLPQLRVPTREEAQDILDVVEHFQEAFLAQSGARFVFAADELYLKADCPFPPLEHYEDFPQWENGVGIVALFRQEEKKAYAAAEPLQLREISLVTGESAGAELTRLAAALSGKTGVQIHVHIIRNKFFGGQVTVTGLLTGRDILAQLQGRPLGEALLVPDVLFKEGEDLLLDDLSLIDLERALGVPVEKVLATPLGLLAGLEVMDEILHGEELE